jgi:hypothetical protein
MLHFFPIVIATAILSGCEKDLDEVENSALSSSTLKSGTVIEQANYYVSPSGSDLNPGTIDKPFKTWDRIVEVVKPGDLVYLRGGVYPRSTRNKGAGCYIGNKSGQSGKYIRLWAYPGETPVLDCKDMTIIGGGVGIRLINSNYWYIKGIELRNVYQKYDATIGKGTDHVGLAISSSSYNIIENVKVYGIGGSGLGMAGTSTKNVIKNCDFFNNYDKYTYNTSGVAYPGGNSDGAHITVAKGTVNTIKGCRFYNNSDDGLDLWENEGVMYVDSCWSFKNGIDNGDGNGFKFGRTLLARETMPQRYIYHCIAYGNKGIGYDQNCANVIMRFYNNIAYANNSMGFYINKYNLGHIFRNNISFSNKYKDLFTAESINLNNSWNGFSISAADFQSLNSAELLYARKPNGDLPSIKFLALNPTSSLVDKGKDVGLPFLGAAPDIGISEVK